MKRKMTQKELKEVLGNSFELYGAHVEKITFKTWINEDDRPEFNGADIMFGENSTNREAGRAYHYSPGELSIMLNRQFNEEGLTAADENNTGATKINFEMGTRMVSGTPIPVFKGCTAQLQEYDRSVDTEYEEEEEYYGKTKPKSLADIRRQEQKESLLQLDDRDIMEMVDAHFRSHPALPGEKSLKMMAIDELANDGHLSDEQRQDMIDRYAQTCIRETKIDSVGFSFSPADLKLNRMDYSLAAGNNGIVTMDSVKVELQKHPLDTQNTEDSKADVYVLAERADGRHVTVGRLPGNFLTNNPMNVSYCDAELQIADYSNGKMKNVSMRLVVNTDLMSGDIVSLDEDMLAGLDRESGVEM